MTWDVGDFYKAAFSVHKCRRYNAKLRDFYRGSHRLIAVANIISATGAFVAYLSKFPALGAALSAVVACASAYDYVVGTERMAALHHDLTRRFTELAARIELMDATSDNLREVRAERLRIEADEPHVKRLVELAAHVEEERARGVDEAQLLPLSRCQHRFGYFAEFGMRRLERWKANEERMRDGEAV